MSKYKILISVLNWKNFPATKKCIESIMQLDYANFKIVIVDNNSPDDSAQKFKTEFPDLTLIESKTNNGYASGHKLAVSYALEHDFDCIWILNNDLTVRAQALSTLVESFKKNGEGIYGGITLKAENPDIINYGGGITDDITLPFNYNNFEDYLLNDYLKEQSFRSVQSVEGSSLLIPLAVIKKHGFMREDFFMYAEETDYCYRIRKQGIKSYVVPESIVIHKGAESLEGMSYLASYYRRRNMLYFERDHYNKKILPNIHKKFGIVNIIKYFIKHMIKGASEDNLYYFNLANLHAILGLKGKIL